MEKKHKILIVDDNNDNLSVLGNILMRQNYTLQVANNGKMAIQVAHKKQPDLILLDINMPGMSGYDVCKELKKEQDTAEIPVVFLTAHTEMENIKQGFSLGAVDYITKPFQEEELLLRVKTHIELKEAKDALKQKNEELNSLNATKDKLFSIIAHDLRGAVGILLNLNELITESNSIDENRMRSYLNSQFELTQSTYFLLVNLLNWAQQNMNQIKYNPKMIDVNNLIDIYLLDMKLLIDQKKIGLETHYKELYKAYADEDMVKLVIRNLLANAIKFTPVNGLITIDIEDNKSMVKVKFSNTGNGILPENIKKILSDHEYLTTRGTDNEIGTGLGMKLVKGFITQNKGTLKIESELNKQTQISFTLPKYN